MSLYEKQKSEKQESLTRILFRENYRNNINQIVSKVDDNLGRAIYCSWTSVANNLAGSLVKNIKSINNAWLQGNAIKAKRIKSVF